MSGKHDLLLRDSDSIVAWCSQVEAECGNSVPVTSCFEYVRLDEVG